jgi:hypothetical protein
MDLDTMLWCIAVFVAVYSVVATILVVYAVSINEETLIEILPTEGESELGEFKLDID